MITIEISDCSELNVGFSLDVTYISGIPIHESVKYQLGIEYPGLIIDQLRGGGYGMYDNNLTSLTDWQNIAEYIKTQYLKLGKQINLNIDTEIQVNKYT